MFVDVAVPIPMEPLTYRALAPAAPGCRVVVPVGKRALTGVVVRTRSEAPPDLPRVRDVIKVLDETPALAAELLKLGSWLAGYYRCSWGEALAAMLPPGYRPAGQEWFHLARPLPADLPLSATAVELQARLRSGPQPRPRLLQDLPAGALRVLRAWETQGWVGSEFRVPGRREGAVPAPAATPPGAPLTLTPHQAAALAEVRAALTAGTYGAFLLHGVTGSGKTEVYLQAMSAALEQGRGAILLVPEISLTPQTCARVTARFGERVAVLHSGLGAGERARAWARLRRGEATIALGARSAVFAPVAKLGLIVVDEEPEATYKQEDVPRYHARDVAAVRAKALGAVLVMGSATPSVEAYHNAELGRTRLLTLPERVDGKRLPEVRLVDLGRELDPWGRVPILSQALAVELEARLARREQSILFLNRRGYAPIVLCPNCRHVLTCPDCSLALVYHQDDDRLHCHACGRVLPPRPACPKCGAACVRLSGAGTQRVEEELKHRFPGARVLRLDQDSARRRGSLEDVLGRFGRREADILLGTQMVAKGIDFPDVTLVGIITADTALHLPDFRAEERTFQLVVQVAGRAGRGRVPGLVLVQTLSADHPLMALARAQDYPAFYRRELEQRRDLDYPPFARLAGVLCRGTDGGAVRRAAEQAVKRLRAAAGPKDQVLGPAPAARARVAREERYRILIKSATVSGRDRVLAALDPWPWPPGVKGTVDVDPQDLL
jgi:primosomal protein N' (replication factor Y) (superfamily II helicase)